MLMDTNLDLTQMDYAQTAHASGKDLISLINEVLDQAKIESGRLELEAVPFDLRDELDNVSSLFSGRCHQKGIEVYYHALFLIRQYCNYLCFPPFNFSLYLYLSHYCNSSS